MLVAQSWITEVLQRSNPGWEVTPEALDAGFVSVGFEIEGEPRSLAEIDGPLTIGRVESIEQLEGFRKPIRFCLVDVGADAPARIVCGASNFAVGDLVVAALPGTTLPGGFEIGARKTYGKVSEGMICSVAELGIGVDHSGILVLPEGTARPGDDATAVLGLDDSVFEVNVTPDRGYALSIRGLARELAAGFGLGYADLAVEHDLPREGDAWPVTVEEGADCVRFAARRVTGIDPTATTPWWMARRLMLAGVRPISPAVDVTNYVMLELGHPMHAFDAAKLAGGLVVRRARVGEKLSTLDGAVRELSTEDVVICDESGPISLAGVMGGASTEVGEDTSDVLLEAAVWSPLAVFRTGRRHKLGSESSRRYERNVDPGATIAALDRAAELLAQIAGGSIAPLLTDIGSVPMPAPISFPVDRPSVVAGTVYPEGSTRRRLEEVGCVVTEGLVEGAVIVSPPSWRPDLRESADLVEEVLRLEGLEGIPSVLPAVPAGRGLTAAQRRRRAVGRALAFGGFVEVLPSPFCREDVFDLWGLDAEDRRRNVTRVLNPLESDRGVLATTLLPAMLEMLARNVSRGRRDVALYGLGQVSLPGPETGAVEMLDVSGRPSDEELTRLERSLPAQPLHVAAVLTGVAEPAGHWGPGRGADPFDAIEAARIVCRAAGVEPEFRNAAHLPWHPGRCAEVVVDEVVVGYAGELHPAVLERCELPARTVSMEIDLDRIPLVENLPAPRISTFPAVLQDVAVVVDGAVPAAEVELALRAGAGPLLEEIRLFDVFTGDQVGTGRKSLAFALRFRAPDRTLTEDECSQARERAVAHAAEAVGARLRG